MHTNNTTLQQSSNKLKMLHKLVRISLMLDYTRSIMLSTCFGQQ